jgi:hypothetical protein
LDVGQQIGGVYATTKSESGSVLREPGAPTFFAGFDPMTFNVEGMEKDDISYNGVFPYAATPHNGREISILPAIAPAPFVPDICCPLAEKRALPHGAVF